MKDEKDSEADAGEAGGVVPTKLFAKISDGKDSEDCKGDDFLNCFELSGVEFVGTDAIGGNLKAVFEKGDAPAGEDDFPQRFATVFEVTVPGEGHEDVGDGEKNNCAHEKVAPEMRKLDATPF